MNIEYPEAVSRILKDAGSLRRAYRKTKDASFKVRAAALEQLAARIRRAVPSDPEDADLGRLAHELTASEVALKPKVQMAKWKGAVLGRRKYGFMLDDYQFFDRSGTPAAIRQAEREA